MEDIKEREEKRPGLGLQPAKVNRRVYTALGNRLDPFIPFFGLLSRLLRRSCPPPIARRRPNTLTLVVIKTD